MLEVINAVADSVGDKNLVDENGNNLVWNFVPSQRNEDLTTVHTNDDLWTFSWISTDSPFRLYLNGIFIGTTTDNTASVVSTSEIFLEVYTASSNVIAYTFERKPYNEIQWYSPDNQSYTLDRFTNTWVQNGRNLGVRGLGYYDRTTGNLGDDEEELWRVVPINEYGTEGTPVERDFHVVSYPNPPVYSATIQNGNLIIYTGTPPSPES